MNSAGLEGRMYRHRLCWQTVAQLSDFEGWLAGYHRTWGSGTSKLARNTLAVDCRTGDFQLYTKITMKHYLEGQLTRNHVAVLALH